MKTTELKPCPWCISDDVDFNGGAMFRWTSVYCRNCHAQGPSTNTDGQRSDAAAMWNALPRPKNSKCRDIVLERGWDVN